MFKKLIFWLIASIIFINSNVAQNSAYHDLTKEADSLYQAKNFALAAQKFSQAFAANGYKAYQTDRYNAACSWALSGDVDSAFYQLFYIVDKVKYSNLRHLTADEDLKSLYSDARWQKLVAAVKANKDAEEANLDKPLVAELEKIHEDDQKYRQQIDAIEKKYGRQSAEMQAHWQLIHEKDSINLIKVTKILDERGWLGADVIGNQGNSTLFLVIQHSDLKTQEKYLPMMREAVKKGKAEGSSLALLEDRILLRNSKKQIYGSQIGRKESGEYYVQALDDPDNVDKRRASVGLPPLSQYISHWNMTWNVEAYKKELPELEKLLKKW